MLNDNKKKYKDFNILITSSYNESLQILLYDFYGRELMNKSLVVEERITKVKINVEHLNASVDLVKILGSSGRAWTHKISVQ